ncbi:hypothetical protein ACIF80_06540 [Streptomyces sp. NPDC085927]|uniref:hypothetical protein n=1 Tax=Streptomyces sp. NPDC085927 TaxID=3365738 RepID=UPI0037D12F3B
MLTYTPSSEKLLLDWFVVPDPPEGFRAELIETEPGVQPDSSAIDLLPGNELPRRVVPLPGTTRATAHGRDEILPEGADRPLIRMPDGGFSAPVPQLITRKLSPMGSPWLKQVALVPPCGCGIADASPGEHISKQHPELF